MLQAVKKFAFLMLLLAQVPSVRAFSLGGPIGNGGDAWQVPTIGYGLGGDLLAPKNIGEEYRRNAPFSYYSYDPNFLDFFGSNGVVAVDQAFAIMNGLTNVSSYSADLSEFPLNSQGVNYTAQALGLVDLKSYTLWGLTEQMGLAEPDRYTWTLHDRFHVGSVACPVGQEYLVTERNFDYMPTSLSQLQYSPYVNGTLYSYYINEICSGPNPLAQATPLLVDPLADFYTAVAAGGFSYGTFYTGLTRDDVAGLRYMLQTNNINYESPASGSQMIVTNNAAQQQLTTLDLGQLIELSKITPPGLLQALYPNLLITSSTNYFQTVTSTNLTLYYTNSPGTAVTNYVPPGILLTNYDFNAFITFSRTNDPATMLAAYPGLQILSYTNYWTNYLTPNVEFAVQRLIGGVSGSSQITLVTNGYSPNFYLYYNYTFGNLLTNSYKSYTSNKLVTVMLTNVIGAPYTGATVVTNYSKWYKDTTTPSGDFFIIPTNWCGFVVVSSNLWSQKTAVTNILSSSQATNSVTLVTNGVAYQSYQYTQHTYTNRIWVVEPGVCEPTLAMATNYTTNIVTFYLYSFGNIVTNSYFTNSPVTVITTNSYFTSGGNGTPVTNVTQVSYYTNKPSGDFYIVPADWCGYSILSTSLTTVVYATNTFVLTNSTGITNAGQQYAQTTVTWFTNHTFIVQPKTCDYVTGSAMLRQGIERVQFIRADYDSLLGQFFAPITNTYTMTAITNSQMVRQYFRRIITAPDFLLSASDLISGPSTDPAASIFYYDRNINFDQGNILSGLAGPGVINSPTTMTFNKSGPIYENDYPFMNGGSVLNYSNSVTWGSFDGTTNAPIVYPNGTSIANLEGQVLVQVSPTTLPAGTVGISYPATVFSSSGGAFSSPYTWNIVDTSVFPPGLSLSSSGTLSGTPTQAGTYDFVIRLTDSLSRTVTWNYTIIIN